MSSWTGRRVWVSGCCGFVGSHLCRYLHDQGADVTGIDVSNSSPSWRVLKLKRVVPVLRNDLRPGSINVPGDSWVRRAAENPPELIYHLAGISHIHLAQEHPLKAWEVNVAATWAVMERAREWGSAVVAASSNHVYGGRVQAAEDQGGGTAGDGTGAGILLYTKPGTPLHPYETAMVPSDVYAASKGAADLIVRCYGRSLGVRACTLRHVNAYGPADPHVTHLVTATILGCLADPPRVTLRGDGSTVKGYLYVDDVVMAYDILGRRLLSDDPGWGSVHVTGKAFNAPGPVRSAKEMIEAVIAVSGRPVELVKAEAGAHDQTGAYESLNGTALRQLGWTEPIWLEEGLAKTWEWYTRHGGMEWTTKATRQIHPGL